MFAALASFAAARLARRRNHHALATARRARRHAHELPEERALLPPHFTMSAARRAPRRLRSRLRADALTDIAGIEQLDLDLFADASVATSDERQPQIDLEISARARPGLLALPAAEHVAEPEVAHEDVERFGEVHMMESATAATTAAAQPGLAVAIGTRRASSDRAKHVVRLRRSPCQLLLLGFLGAGVLIGVPLHREATVRLLDVVVGRAAFNAKNCVKVGHAVESGIDVSQS